MNNAKTIAFAIFGFALSATAALATPTQEEVFRSISDNVGEKSGSGHFLALLMAVAGVVVVGVMLSKRERKQSAPRALNHQGKLLREVMRNVNLRPAELRQLRSLAEAQSLDSPLTLLLCPSVLEKAIKEKPSKVERKVMMQITRKLGLAGNRPKS